MDRVSPPEASIEDLLVRARAGDQGALEELFSRCRPKLGVWAERHFKRSRPGLARPSDLAQETALRAFHRFSTFSGTSAPEWFAWLAAIVRNLAAQSLRDAKRQKRDAPGAIPLDSPEAMAVPALQKSPSQATALEEEWRRLLTFIYQLPPDQRDAICLCHLKDLPVAEVARQMRKTEIAVAGLLQRGLQALRTRMAKGSDPEPANLTDSAVSLNDAAAALLAYLRRRDRGERLDPDAFVAEYPTCAEELRSMLRWMERIQALRPASSGA